MPVLRSDQDRYLSTNIKRPTPTAAPRLRRRARPPVHSVATTRPVWSLSTLFHSKILTIVNRAIDEAHQFGARWVTTDHLMYAMHEIDPIGIEMIDTEHKICPFLQATFNANRRRRAIANGSLNFPRPRLDNHARKLLRKVERESQHEYLELQEITLILSTNFEFREDLADETFEHAVIHAESTPEEDAANEAFLANIDLLGLDSAADSGDTGLRAAVADDDASDTSATKGAEPAGSRKDDGPEHV